MYMYRTVSETLQLASGTITYKQVRTSEVKCYVIIVSDTVYVLE
jgi:hypothetical protein